MKKTHLKGANIMFAAIICIFVMGSVMPSIAADSTEQQGLVDKARVTFDPLITASDHNCKRTTDKRIV